ncbi:universal stress protein [Streptomyces sp. NPDC048290]|uniref:universal stress protein n=1 Tax=Streptomyces sp. NPDC048290 TaxID=3155811 RepID=UPI00342B4F40
MSTSSKGRVVVGVDDSWAGCGALRVAVDQARRTGRDLLAVHAYALPLDPVPTVPGESWLLPGSAGFSGPGAVRARQAAEREQGERALDAIRDAFGRAIGGIPSDLRVCLVASVGSPAEVLVATAWRDDDLLVVGKPPVHRLLRLCPWRWLHRPVWRRCATDAACPVLAVPPDSTAHPAEAPPQRDDPTAAPPASGDAGPDPVVWPERSCCCSAPPVARAVLPVAGDRDVDLFLCGHHFRSSLGPLALADAEITFRADHDVLPAADRPV